MPVLAPARLAARAEIRAPVSGRDHAAAARAPDDTGPAGRALHHRGLEGNGRLRRGATRGDLSDRHGAGRVRDRVRAVAEARGHASGSLSDRGAARTAGTARQRGNCRRTSSLIARPSASRRASPRVASLPRSPPRIPTRSAICLAVAGSLVSTARIRARVSLRGRAPVRAATAASRSSPPRCSDLDLGRLDDRHHSLEARAGRGERHIDGADGLGKRRDPIARADQLLGHRICRPAEPGRIQPEASTVCFRLAHEPIAA